MLWLYCKILRIHGSESGNRIALHFAKKKRIYFAFCACVCVLCFSPFLVLLKETVLLFHEIFLAHCVFDPRLEVFVLLGQGDVF